MARIFVPISTPFAEDEEVDYDVLRFNLERYAVSGVLGYLALGSNGENRSLTEEEKLRVLGTIVRHRVGGQVVMACATYDAQRDTEQFLEQAAGLGADFGLVLPPSYFRKQMTDEVLFQYFSTLADTAPFPLLLYNAPGFCGVTLSPALVGRLAQHRGHEGQRVERHRGILKIREPGLSRAGGLGQLSLSCDDGWFAGGNRVAGKLVPGSGDRTVPLRAGS